MRHDRRYPPRLLLQWHITDRCNLRCAHCYQDACAGAELSLHDSLAVIEQFTDFLNLCGPSARGHITVTGGEPFVRNDFPDLIEILASHQKRFGFAILTNGTRIDAGMARHLKKRGAGFVQVSIEGTQITHDRIRGSGTYEHTVAAVHHLVKAGVRTLISFTAHRGNFREFEDVARLGRQLRVSRVWADRLIPQGARGSDLQSLVLTSDETREFLEIMKRARKEAERAWLNRTDIALNRALQFLASGARPYRCTAGHTLITVMPDGGVYPCRRMPVRVGNLLETPLRDLYHCEFFQSLRDPARVSKGCEGCFYFRVCRGGLKCLAYAVKGDPFHADPGCWRARHSQSSALS